MVIRWLRDTLGAAKRTVFHNAHYDLGWLETDFGIRYNGRPDDTHAMAVMLDENRMSYSLDKVAEWQGIRGKDETLLSDTAASLGYDAKKDLWRMPAKYVGPYATQDAVATFDLAKRMLPLLENESLMEAYTLEMDIVQMVNDMRRRGIRIDIEKTIRLKDEFLAKRDAALAEMTTKLVRRRAVEIDDCYSPASLEVFFKDENLTHPTTPKTKRGQFESDWLEAQPHWLPQLVATARKWHDAGNKFLGNYILGNTEMGRIHAEIHQLRDDTGGTRSYRFSYSNPPLQQMPAHDPEIGPAIRGVFLPEEGQLWGALDYSQQEPRLTVHYAAECSIAGADVAVDYYNFDNDPDYHTMVAKFTGLPRKKAKIINLGLAYGMGRYKLALSLGVSLEEADVMLKIYDDEVPFVKRLSNFCSSRANARGYIRLIDGARCRFDRWEPSWRGENDEGHPATTIEKARQLWPKARLRRAFTHKAMNRLIQGSAARQTKKAMRDCYREGILPLIQMHDELGFSFGEETQMLTAKQCMVDAVKLRVPVTVDAEIGYNWGEAKYEWQALISQSR